MQVADFKVWGDAKTLQRDITKIERDIERLVDKEDEDILISNIIPRQPCLHPLGDLVYTKFQRLEQLIFILRKKLGSVSQVPLHFLLVISFCKISHTVVFLI